MCSGNCILITLEWINCVILLSCLEWEKGWVITHNLHVYFIFMHHSTFAHKGWHFPRLFKHFKFSSVVFSQPNFLTVLVKIQFMSWVDFFPLLFFFLLKQSFSLEYFKAVLTISCWVGLFFGYAVKPWSHFK